MSQRSPINIVPIMVDNFDSSLFRSQGDPTRKFNKKIQEYFILSTAQSVTNCL